MVDAWMRCVLFVAIPGGVGAQGGGKPHLPLPLVQAQAASDVQTSTRSSLPLPASPPLLLLPLPTPPPPIWLLSPPPPWLPLIPPPCTVLPCNEASDVSRLNRGLQLTVPSHRRELQTYVNTVAGLTSALANTAVGRIVLASGTYYLSAELNITRSVILEAAVAGSVVLDAQASSSISTRVLNVNPGSLGVVQLIGLNVTGGYNNIDGGGVFINSGTVTLSSCTITGNTADFDGGGVYVSGGTVTFSSCTITGNTATAVRAHAQNFPSPRWENG